MIIMIIIISTLNLFSQILLEKSELELTNLQVNDIECVNNNLYILTQLDNNVAIDKLNLNTNQMYNDFLNEKGFKVSAEATLFKSKDGNLWIGDNQKLLKVNPITNEVINYFQYENMDDSTSYRVTSITEDDIGNKYCLMWNSKTIFKTESGGTTYHQQVWTYELMKFNGERMEKILDIENNGFLDSKVFFYKGYILFSTWKGFETKIYIINTKNYEFEIVKFNSPNIEELDDWETVEEFRILDFFALNEELYIYSNMEATMSSFHAISKFNIQSKEIEHYTLDYDPKGRTVKAMQSYCVIDNQVIVSTNYYNKPNKKFFKLENKKFKSYNIEHLVSPKLITRKNHFESLLEWNRLDLLSLEHRISSGIFIDEKGTLYGGSDNGIIKIDNFIQPSSNVKNKELNIRTIPDLSNVKNELYIESEFNINSYKVFDINSRTIRTKSNLNTNSINLNLEGLTLGIYFIEIETQKGKKLLKFIKN